MDMENYMKQVMASLVPVKGSISEEEIAQLAANETPLQKKFDNRIGPSVDGSPQIDYHVFSPVKEDDKTRYPVLIWLHGMSQGKCFREPLRGTDVANFVSPEYQAKFGDGAYVVVPRANEDLGMYATYGFMYTNSWVAGNDEIGTSKQLPELVAAIKQFFAEEEENIDFSRVYLTGFSAGGYMTWQTLLAMPDVFAAAAPICHARFVPTEEQLATVAHVPIWVICGEKDRLYESYVAPTVEKLKTQHPSELLRITILEIVYNPDRSHVEDQHFSWVPVTFDMFYSDGAPYDEKYPEGFIAWLNEHSKQMSCLKFCTCKHTVCPMHPIHHNGECAPCIEKNLKHHEIPACFWNKIGETENAKSEYTFRKFADKVLACETNI